MIRQILFVATVAIFSPAPASALTCAPGPWIVFFDENAAYADRNARDVLNDVSRAIGSCGSPRVMLEGHTDTQENRRLAFDRLDMVRSYLEAHGMPHRSITVRSFGSRHPRIARKDDMTERQNRRVEIYFAPLM
ncbi:OmpA family protein [Sphingobium sp. 3R8]|nr:OmpA family protein [Sphingobium sp. 3R8]